MKLVRDKVVKVDLKDRKVMTSGGKELSYDYLVQLRAWSTRVPPPGTR